MRGTKEVCGVSGLAGGCEVCATAGGHLRIGDEWEDESEGKVRLASHVGCLHLRR